jgi:hypothetical protein
MATSAAHREGVSHPLQRVGNISAAVTNAPSLTASMPANSTVTTIGARLAVSRIAGSQSQPGTA